MTPGPPRRRTARRAGNSLIEVLIAISLFAILMTAGMTSLVTQMRRHASETLTAETLHAARLALDVMADQLALAGFGVPRAMLPSVAPMLLTTEARKLSFWTSVNATHTFLTAASAFNSSAITVLSATGLKVGGSLFVTDASNWYFGTVASLKGNTVQLKTPLSYNFAAGAQVAAVEKVTFDLFKTQLRRNGRPFVRDVADLTFTYDTVVPSAVRSVTIQLTLQGRAVDVDTGARPTVSLYTTVAPPNLAL